LAITLIPMNTVILVSVGSAPSHKIHLIWRCFRSLKMMVVGRIWVNLVPLVLSCQLSEIVISSSVLLAMIFTGVIMLGSTTSLLTLEDEFKDKWTVTSLISRYVARHCYHQTAQIIDRSPEKYYLRL
jgi:hypothetical protein